MGLSLLADQLGAGSKPIAPLLDHWRSQSVSRPIRPSKVPPIGEQNSGDHCCPNQNNYPDGANRCFDFPFLPSGFPENPSGGYLQWRALRQFATQVLYPSTSSENWHSPLHAAQSIPLRMKSGVTVG